MLQIHFKPVSIIKNSVFHFMFNLPSSLDSIFLFPYFLTRIDDK